MSVQGKTKRKSHLEPDVAMMLLTTRIQKVDRQLAQEFGRFNRISESIEKENKQICELLLKPIFRPKRLEKARSQQQRDVARSFETEEQIGRLLEGRSDAISNLARCSNMHWARFGDSLRRLSGSIWGPQGGKPRRLAG